MALVRCGFGATKGELGSVHELCVFLVLVILEGFILPWVIKHVVIFGTCRGVNMLENSILLKFIRCAFTHCIGICSDWRH